MAEPLLFQPIEFRSVKARNRIAVAPMCQYSAHDGLGDDWHVQHLGSKAMGGAGIVFTEATAVADIGRITYGCLGLYDEATHTPFLARLAAMIASGGAVPGIQIAHAGRKASTQLPWEGGKPIPMENGGWLPNGPSAEAFGEGYTVPHALGNGELAAIASSFAATARRAREAGFKIAEIHGAHGYLLHSFLSPIANRRNDAYGGSLSGRARLLMEVIDAVRAEWPADLPLFVRLSCVDYMAGGLAIEDTVEISRWIKARGDVDLIDCSSGGIASAAHVPSLHPGYQVPFADRIRAGAGIATGAVGLITEPTHAAEILANGRADIVLIARALLADPAWPLRAARDLGAKVPLPPQYLRASLH